MLLDELFSLRGACVHLYDNPRILRRYKVCKIIRVLFRVYYIRFYAAELKDSFCKTVDLAVNENLEEVDQIQKTETKQLDTYIDQVTTDKLSLVSRLRTSDDIVQKTWSEHL
jgi:hypothetical protein